MASQTQQQITSTYDIRKLMPNQYISAVELQRNLTRLLLRKEDVAFLVPPGKKAHYEFLRRRPRQFALVHLRFNQLNSPPGPNFDLYRIKTPPFFKKSTYFNSHCPKPSI